MALSKVIYIMGPPGGGKGTQAEMLAEKIGYHRFSTGNAFRDLSRQDTPLGHRVKNTIDNGLLMPPADAAQVVIAAIKKHVDSGMGLIFDGTPRTIEEAADVDAFFEKGEYGKPLALYLKVDKAEMIERNSKRKFCLGVSGDFPVASVEDRVKCDDMGGKVGTRPDDEPEIFTTRWNEFMTKTYPVVERYLASGVARELDGMQPIDDVHEQVMQVIDELR